MSSEQSQLSMSDFYTPLDMAVEELHRRRKSPGLQEKVRKEVKLPSELEVLFERPHLVMFRQVLTPLYETLLFFELAKKYELTPFVIEYYDDKFVSTGNQFKRSLGKLPIHQFTTAGGRDVFEYKTIVNFNQHVGHPLRSVLTIHGESLISLHHQLFFEAANIKPVVISRDGSSWFKQFENSKEYYKHFLKLFIRDNILFETFLTEGAEYELTSKTVLPAYEQNREAFTFKPLISMATYENSSTDLNILNLYPKSLAAILEKKGYILNNGVPKQLL
jgi:hypothetical protein